MDAVRVVEALADQDPKQTVSRVDMKTQTAIVVLESDKPDNLVGLDASTMALQWAQAHGVPFAALNDDGTQYTVDRDGNMLTEFSKGFPPGGKFRRDYKIRSMSR